MNIIMNEIKLLNSNKKYNNRDNILKMNYISPNRYNCVAAPRYAINDQLPANSGGQFSQISRVALTLTMLDCTNI